MKRLSSKLFAANLMIVSILMGSSPVSSFGSEVPGKCYESEIIFPEHNNTAACQPHSDPTSVGSIAINGTTCWGGCTHRGEVTQMKCSTCSAFHDWYATGCGCGLWSVNQQVSTYSGNCGGDASYDPLAHDNQNGSSVCSCNDPDTMNPISTMSVPVNALNPLYVPLTACW
ncbi:MAG: hypothetical protein RLZZ350_2449 [Verrucomicrobiota bacterium]|jgi:hypothetical protein